MNTKKDLINRASKMAGDGSVTDAIVDELLPEYESLKRKYIEERDWIFSLRVARMADITATTDGLDRGFAYRYKINIPGVLDVRTINTNTYIPAWTEAASQDQLLRVGYSRGDITATSSSPATAWEYIDGVLYSDTPVCDAIIKINPEESALPEAFAWTLVYALAAVISLGDNKNHEHFRAMQSQLNKAHNEALRDWNKRPPRLTLDDELILQWLQTFYRQSRNY